MNVLVFQSASLVQLWIIQVKVPEIKRMGPPTSKTIAPIPWSSSNPSDLRAKKVYCIEITLIAVPQIK
jgi:hypothetical protein